MIFELSQIHVINDNVISQLLILILKKKLFKYEKIDENEKFINVKFSTKPYFFYINKTNVPLVHLALMATFHISYMGLYIFCIIEFKI